ncbi:hypothetical protein ACFQ1E_08515 [Sphingomonas canadensis]|uniref:Lipoprotein n=1 Tax=Sphingomonas canadensis TaxID=1219257 RepID=A0ABW3H5E2_9SPHN|nr:hypothetical protein [Sphingomonas canadensis]MCW3836081.1 hypothetical protein [Sphingomonas canadensis]
MSVAKLIVPAIALAVLGGCSRTGEIAAAGGGAGITALRTPCPYVAVPAATGDVTLFSSPTVRTEDAIDVTAALTNVTSTCADEGEQVTTSVNFEVFARRTNGEGARDVQLPYFVALVRGGSSVVAKRIGTVTLHFEPGQLRASATGSGSTVVNRAAATLPQEVRDRLTKRRKAGEQEAAMDPLSDPAIRTAVLSATFEALVGFQLTDDQLKYNATR